MDYRNKQAYRLQKDLNTDKKNKQTGTTEIW